MLLAEIAVLKSGGALNTTFKGAQEETEMVLFSSIKHVLDSVNLSPGQVCALQSKRIMRSPAASQSSTAALDNLKRACSAQKEHASAKP